MGLPLVTIVIPCKNIDKYTKECVRECLKLNYPNYEIIVLPDRENNATEFKTSLVKIVGTGAVTPGAKRNIAMKHAKGELIAYIDSDAYPKKNWLLNTIKYFDKDQVAAVTGPGITPPNDDPMRKASGYVYEVLTRFTSLAGRFSTTRAQEVDDAHSCNLIIKRKVLEEVKGWNEKYWPGEDTLLCNEILRRGYRIISAPDVVVFHHRKPLYKPHLVQVARFGLHRGFFAKKYKGNSLKLRYFAPLLLLLYLIIGIIVSIFNSMLRLLFILTIIAYIAYTLILAMDVTKEKKLIPHVVVGTILSQLTYGVYFMIGLIVPELKR
ncbi:MAG: hypothetical protein DRM97_07835, partial [Thermoprotei archaeon]